MTTPSRSAARRVTFMVACTLLLGSNLIARAASAAPLLAFVGKDANFDDEFSFVAVEDLPSSTVLYFTNCDWDNTTGAFLNPCVEGVVELTTSALVAKGSVVRIVESSANVFAVSVSGTAVHVTGTGDWAAVSADPHYAFSASNAASPLDTVTEIHAYLDTDPDVALGGEKDPRIGVNASPGAHVCDFSGIQPVGTDFIGDRAAAGFGNLTHPVNFDQGTEVDTILDLGAFPNIAAGAIFVDGFESGNLLGWSAVTGAV